VLGKPGRLDDLEAAIVEIVVALVDWASEWVPGVGPSEARVELKVDPVAPVSARGREDVEVLEAVFAVFAMFAMFEPCLGAESRKSSPSASCLEVPPPTASLNRLYNPLKPCCTNSPAMLLLSVGGSDPGGDPKSLNVVRVSVRLADVCILSSFWASCSLSTWVDDAEGLWEFMESRRGRRPRLDIAEAAMEADIDTGDGGTGFDALVLFMAMVGETNEDASRLGYV
jgi:hypothetical protein